jgi:predicted dehydrogenase
MKSYSDISVAIVGTGFMGPAHTDALRRLGVRITGITGSSPAKSSAAAASLGLPKGYPDFAAVLADDSVSAVHITTPNRWHHQMVTDALTAGKHVMCEKPLAMNSQESADLVAKAAASGLHAGVNYNLRFYPLALESAERVRSGATGAIHSITGSYVQDWLLFPNDYNWRVLSEEGGELRAIADIGTHWLDLVAAISGLKVTQVLADLKTIHPVRNRPVGEVQTFSGTQADATEPVEISTEDQGAVLLRLSNGATGVLWVSQATAGRKNRLSLELAGAKSTLAWDSELPNELFVGHRNEPNQRLLKDPGLLQGTARYHAGYPGGHNEGYPDSFKQCFRAFYDAILGIEGAAAYPTFTDGHQEILLCEAILKSHREQTWTAVAPK